MPLAPPAAVACLTRKARHCTALALATASALPQPLPCCAATPAVNSATELDVGLGGSLTVAARQAPDASATKADVGGSCGSTAATHSGKPAAAGATKVAGGYSAAGVSTLFAAEAGVVPSSSAAAAAATAVSRRGRVGAREEEVAHLRKRWAHPAEHADHTGAAAELAERAVSDLRRQGFAVLEEAFPTETMAALEQEHRRLDLFEYLVSFNAEQAAKRDDGDVAPSRIEESLQKAAESCPMASAIRRARRTSIAQRSSLCAAEEELARV